MSQILNSILTLILVVAIPFLISMITVYAVYSSRHDDSSSVCPDKNGKYGFDQLAILGNQTSYRKFVEKCAEKTSFPLIGAVIRKSERNTKHEYACAAFVVTPNSAVTSSTCLNNTDKTEISNIYQVHSYCDKWNSETCLVHLIRSVDVMPQDDNSDFHMAILEIMPEVPTDDFGEVLLVERPCSKDDNGILNCADLAKKTLHVYFWKKTGTDYSIKTDTIKVEPTCGNAKKNQICFVYSDCDEIHTGVVLDTNDKFIGCMMEDACRTTGAGDSEQTVSQQTESKQTESEQIVSKQTESEQTTVSTTRSTKKITRPSPSQFRPVQGG